MGYKPPFTITNAILKYVASISEKLGLKSKEGFRRNYLVPAIEMKLIRMTIPEQPRNRNQRYVKCQ